MRFDGGGILERGNEVRLSADQAPVAQGIEHSPPEAGAQVRILSGAPRSKSPYFGKSLLLPSCLSAQARGKLPFALVRLGCPKCTMKRREEKRNHVGLETSLRMPPRRP